MTKRLLLSAVIIASMLTFAGCNSNGKQLNAIKDAQTKLSSLESGHMTVKASMKTDKKTDFTATDFTYKKNAGGLYEYCQEGRDSDNKLVFCEVSDGEKAEQWLIGKGWSVITPVAYTADSNHRFIELITNEIDKKAIQSFDSVAQEGNTLYNIVFDIKRLNETIYKDTSIEVISQEMSFLVNAEGQIITYDDKACILDKNENTQAEYSVSAQISEHNALVELKKPEVKVDTTENSTETNVEVEEK